MLISAVLVCKRRFRTGPAVVEHQHKCVERPLNNDSSAVLFGVFNMKHAPIECGCFFPTT
jgi:hypothetical protein